MRTRLIKLGSQEHTLLNRGTLRLLQQQKGRCLLFRDYLLLADREPTSLREWEQWLIATTSEPFA